MTSKWRCENWKLKLARLLAANWVLAELAGVSFFGNNNYVLAQITPDRSLGAEASVVTPNVEIKGLPAERIDGGAIRDANLFHSFEQFNIGDLQRVYFANPAGITNIFSRVTGSNLSEIFGTLGVNGNANLFLINPNGIIFGENASLDVGGSFAASTADAIQFGDGTQFSTNASQTGPLLTVSIPIGLQFGGNNESIKVQGNGQGQRSTSELIDNNFGLRVQPDQTLALVGGNLVLEGATLKTAGGRIELGSVAGSGLVSLTPINSGFALGYLDVPTFGDIQLSGGATVDASGSGGGDIQVEGGRMTLQDGSQIEASTLGAESGGEIAVNASDAIELIGSTADIQFPAIGAQVYPGAAGAGGNLTLETGRLILKDGAQLSSNTLGSGAGGSIEIRASDSVELVGQAVGGQFPTSIGAQVSPEATGAGGEVTIETKRLSVINSQVGTVTLGKGNAGNFTVRASDSVEVSGKILRNNIENPAGLLAQVNVDGEGKGGNLNIETGRLSVSNGGKVQVATFGQGDAGNLTIRASEVEVFDTSGGSLYATGINAGVEIDVDETVTPPKGNGGNLTIETDRLSIRNGATVSVATAGEGNAGTLQIRAPEFVEVLGISRNGKFKSQVSAEVTSDAIGSGGNLSIETGQMIIRDGAEVTVSSLGSGVAGTLEIQARSISLDNQGAISATTKSGNGGDITLKGQELLLLRDGSEISTTAGTAQAGGDGGDINIAADLIAAIPQENSDITANAFAGKGGNINVQTRNIFGFESSENPNLSNITASSQFGLDGTVNINTSGIEPTRELGKLPVEVVDVSRLIDRNLCLAGQDNGEFIITGRGGLSPSPQDTLNADAGWEDWRIVENSEFKDGQSSPARSISEVKNSYSNQVIEAQSWFRAANGNIILSAQPVKSVSRSSSFSPFDCHLLDKLEQ
jgi:filamentous hemagglutinin family protein